MSAGPETELRIDVWLWRARFFKTRALAAKAVAEGAMRLFRGQESRAIQKASLLVRPGDGITFSANGTLRTVRVLGLGQRRGPAAEARALYEDQAGDSAAPERPPD